MRKIMLALALVLIPTPAYAYHGGQDRCRGEQREGNCNDRRENYDHAQCKYACPNFDKSPVHDAFNFSPFICMPGATCYQKDPEKKEPNKDGQEPTAAPDLLCTIRNLPYHCDPKPR